MFLMNEKMSCDCHCYIRELVQRKVSGKVVEEVETVELVALIYICTAIMPCLAHNGQTRNTCSSNFYASNLS